MTFGFPAAKPGRRPACFGVGLNDQEPRRPVVELGRLAVWSGDPEQVLPAVVLDPEPAWLRLIVVRIDRAVRRRIGPVSRDWVAVSPHR